MHTERRSPCVLKWRITCRRPVIAAVIRLNRTLKPTLKHIEMPWMVSPSAGLELRHADTDVSPESSISFLAARATKDGKLDQRFVEIIFIGGAFVRVHWHDDTAGVECLGLALQEPVAGFESMFYCVMHSDWIANLPSHFSNHVHYILDGRDGCIEIAATGYNWREWIWPTGVTLAAVLTGEPFATGTSVG